MANDAVNIEAPSADDGFTMHASAQSLDGTFRRGGRLRGWVYLAMMPLIAWLVLQHDDEVCRTWFIALPLFTLGIMVVTSDGREALRHFATLIDLRFSIARDDRAPRFVRVRGRAIVRRGVREATYGEGVGAYFEITPSPNERAANMLACVLLWPWAGRQPEVYTECGIGRLEIALEDGRRASIETDAFTLVDRRRFGFREALRTVVREGDLVEVRGIAHVRRTETNDAVYVFAGEHESMVKLAVLAR